jgi:hypothetical protein
MRTFARYSPVDTRITKERVLGRLDKSFLQDLSPAVGALRRLFENVIRHGVERSVCSRRPLLLRSETWSLESNWGHRKYSFSANHMRIRSSQANDRRCPHICSVERQIGSSYCHRTPGGHRQPLCMQTTSLPRWTPDAHSVGSE